MTFEFVKQYFLLNCKHAEVSMEGDIPYILVKTNIEPEIWDAVREDVYEYLKSNLQPIMYIEFQYDEGSEAE